MVKHGTNKKRRSGRTGRTKLKNRTYHRWNPHPKFTDATVAAHWDVSKSPAINLAQMGLIAKPNKRITTHTPTVEDAAIESTQSRIEVFDIPPSDNLKPKRKTLRPLSDDEQRYMKTCLDKYNDQYERMSKDHKVNYLQHSTGQLRKLAARYPLASL